MGYLTFTGEIGTEVRKGYLAETVAGQQYITLQSGVILDGSITLPASAVVAGPDGNTDAGTITIITNPKTGITSVSNAASFEGGRNTETDDEFRARYYVSTDFAGGVNLDAIIAAIYENVEAVIAVTGEENDTDETNASGLPPHSIELVVYGGLDEEIAKSIHRRKGAGIQTYGNVTVPVVDAAGNIKNICFSRPAPVNVWVKVFNLQTDNTFPLDGIEQIKQRLAEYIGSDTRGGLNIGQNVICVALPTEVFKVQGVVDFDLQISSDGETYSWKNITIAAREKAVTNEDMVVVE